jgi:hypothetical protein
MDLYGDLPTWGLPGFPADMNKWMFGYCGDIWGNMNFKTLSLGDVEGIQWLYPVPGLPDFPDKIGVTNGQPPGIWTGMAMEPGTVW